MAERIDIARLGRQIRKKRTNERLSLRELAEATKLKIPTLSRIERGDSMDIESSTLLALCRWLAIDPESLQNQKPRPVTRGAKILEETPDILDVYLRADKNLDRNTVQSLSELFRTAYQMALKHPKKNPRY
jgi:transcriptional regulator with XRE-family HTH domain